jgi:high-affinity nickel-transport protein
MTGRTSLFNDWIGSQRKTVCGIYTVLAAANVFAWVWATAEFANRPALLGTALLAYIFGLRHAVDADHIATIDNVVRKLMQEGKQPLAAGFFFSFGHSTVVVLATIAIAGSATTLQTWFAAFKDIGASIGSAVSVFFLLAIAVINLVILRDVWRNYQNFCRRGRLDDENMKGLLSGRGGLARFFRPVFRLIGMSWHMYPLGFLFALGFDTATEIGVLGMSAAPTADGISLETMLIFPILFTAGMVLVDTMDGVFMTRAYGWAFADPTRKFWYNITITAMSVLFALLIGGLEVLALVVAKIELHGSFWNAVSNANDALGSLGAIVIVGFPAFWIVWALLYRWKPVCQSQA